MNHGISKPGVKYGKRKIFYMFEIYDVQILWNPTNENSTALSVHIFA